ncbi:MAG: hypothetical protein WB797_06850 [Nocardioides sp.]
MNRLLDFFPDWRRSNPFQDMLFSGLGRTGATPEPVTDLIGHLTAEAPPGRVLNVHWTTPVLGRVRRRGPHPALRRRRDGGRAVRRHPRAGG